MIDMLLNHWFLIVCLTALAGALWMAWLFISAPLVEDDYDPYF